MAVTTLTYLAAKTAGRAFQSGRFEANRALRAKKYPRKLIKLVLRFVTMSFWEWDDFLREEECFPRLDNVILSRLKVFYKGRHGVSFFLERRLREIREQR
jgi:hypothetical protein